jgi:hypothetical protein
MSELTKPKFTLDARHPELTEHNLEQADLPSAIDTHRQPVRDVTEADFGAEAHGFTGYEAVGRGSRYKSSPDKKTWRYRLRQLLGWKLR